MQFSKQNEVEVGETSDTFDSIAELISVYNKVKIMMVKLEQEVFEVSQHLISMPMKQANTLKGKVWTMWNAQ